MQIEIVLTTRVSVTIGATFEPVIFFTGAHEVNLATPNYKHIALSIADVFCLDISREALDFINLILCVESKRGLAALAPLRQAIHSNLDIAERI